MELNGKMSNAVKIALAVISVVLLLVIGGALGASLNYHRGYGYGDRGCGFNNFERGDRNGNRQYRMMQFQEVPVNQVNQTPSVNQGTPINTPSAPVVNPAPTVQ